MQLLVDALYNITISLSAPTIVALLILLVWTLYETGGFLREWRNRKTAVQKWNEFLAMIHKFGDDNVESLKNDFYQLESYPTLLTIFAERSKDFPNNNVYLNKLISEIEIKANKSCHIARTGVRIGPMLGLMGTLIPMGPALKAIANGNLETMSNNLIIAFSTTVTGLTIAGLCYIIFIARQHWYAKDMSDIEYLLETIFSAKGEK